VTVETLPSAALVAGTHVRIKVPVLVTNNSTATVSGKTTVTLLASSDDALDGTDVVVTSTFRQLRLRAGKSRKLSLRLSTIPDMVAGLYKVLGIVRAQDGGGSVSVAPSPVSIVAPVIDLSAILILPPTGPLPAGHNTHALIQIGNEGNTVADGFITVSLVAVPTTIAAPVPIGAVPLHIKLNPQMAKQYELKFNIGMLAAGTYSLKATINGSPLGDTTALNDVVVSPTTFAVS
jgi:hypothetical protein